MELSFYWKKTDKKSKICVLKDVICAMEKKKKKARKEEWECMGKDYILKQSFEGNLQTFEGFDI